MHIAINAAERSLLYAAETLEQFGSLLQCFDNLDKEENDAWWRLWCLLNHSLHQHPISDVYFPHTGFFRLIKVITKHVPFLKTKIIQIV